MQVKGNENKQTKQKIKTGKQSVNTFDSNGAENDETWRESISLGQVRRVGCCCGSAGRSK